MTSILFIGHCTKDVITIHDETSNIPGGGVYFGASSAGYCLKQEKKEGVSLKVLTIGNPIDFEVINTEMKACGSDLSLIPDQFTTTFIHSFEDNNPDKRISSVGDIARPFTWDDIKDHHGKLFYVNPLFFGEIDPVLFINMKQNCQFIFVDSQGLLRHQRDGKIFLRPPQDLHATLENIHILKVDTTEAEALTGIKDSRKACLALLEYGPQWIIYTQSSGVELHTKDSFISSPFSSWTLQGRTGRGDTVSAAFLLLHFILGYDAQKSLDMAAKATCKKMQHPGAAKMSDFED